MAHRYQSTGKLGQHSRSLTDEQEELLYRWVLGQQNKGFSPTDEAILVHAQKTFGLTKKLGRQFFTGFQQRHPNLCGRKGNGLTPLHANALTTPVVQEFYSKIAQHTDLLDLELG
eukprot:TRINITY_DN67368_c1_g1_i7.p1 TRINITY_DN67368_c1_g1~~TRINITY_DN67368_c1_g1_i7.p1  ORF type:complete len:115 (-),score=10.74 TRINITY_DN67368_c1_g1_i7:217-561(-)